ncbi:MAG: antitoxin [Phenylobacterium sp.]|uniref:antitoxin n=1 Tax=Phenylobacterium sp. TaxID=1871053 RepID=UPI003BB6BC36
MAKPPHQSGYDADITADCERLLVTLIRGLGPWQRSVYLVGGLVPRYLVKARPPEVRAHAGTGDIDLVVDLAMLTDIGAYETLEKNLQRLGFERAKVDGVKVSWRWQAKTERGVTLVVEFLADDPNLRAAAIQPLPTKGKVSALNIPHASMVFDLHDKVLLTAEQLNGEGVTTIEVAHANLVSFCCLKTFAFAQRNARKDAHDLVYCLVNAEGGIEAAAEQFKTAMGGQHADVISQALYLMARHFCDEDPDKAYRRDGPVAVAKFEIAGDGEEAREDQALRQRNVAEAMGKFIDALKAG